MRLSLLDRSRTRDGEPAGAALSATVARAVRAEELGFERFWVAEHHGVPGIASGSPPVLLAAIGARTSAIRIGSGGVMLPHHQPLVVAEQFLMLEALYPGRVDLGLGRSSGFTPPVRRALRETGGDAGEGSEAFADDLAELRSYLDGTGAVTAQPAGAGPVAMHVLATGRGLEVAARLGLPVVVGGPMLGREDVRDVLDGYRRSFRPHPGGPESPAVTVSVDALVADTDAQAREWALPEAYAGARSRETGSFASLEPAASIRGRDWSRQVSARVEESVRRSLSGTAATVARGLERLVEQTGAEEVLVFSSTYDADALGASDRALAGLAGRS